MNLPNLFHISSSTVYDIQHQRSTAIQHAWRMVARDHQKVFGKEPQIGGFASIVVRYARPDDPCPDWPEAFGFCFSRETRGIVLHIVGRDELGVMYGLLHYSHQVLGVDPFWFWSEKEPAPQNYIVMPIKDEMSVQPAVRFRGWFVNDEVCLIGWKPEYPPTKEVWMPVFEALLRCGGNMVIPGTDLPRHGVHHKLAHELGLWITHHHAEPLGAEMFLRAYPGQQASYQEHPELFQQLWEEAIQRQKDQKTVWVLSFRGQGDKPFWENDPAFDTPEKRGALISRVVRTQYDMICKHVVEPVCSMAMYGEIAELYKQGYIEVPLNVMKIWADNGYGKMVSRRHGNLNLRVPALPDPHDQGRNGLYYHVTFHDLQASNHLTMYPSSASLIADELQQAFDARATDYLLLNSGNILQHIYMLDLVKELWNGGHVDVDQHLRDFVARQYSSNREAIVRLYKNYAKCTVQYGPHPDDRAGEEFYHHPARQLMVHWLKGDADCCEGLIWATGERNFLDQVIWFMTLVEGAITGWEQIKEQAHQVLEGLNEAEQSRLYNQLLVQFDLHLSGCQGLTAICRAYEAYYQGHYPQAFIFADDAVNFFSTGRDALDHAQQGRWESFYSADWLTNIDNTIIHVKTVRNYIRVIDDGPDLFRWYKEYLMPETEKYIYLENTHRKPLPDNVLAERLKLKLLEE